MVAAFASALAPGLEKLRQPEIKNLGVSALCDEDVCGLDVPVDDAI